jgi:ATP-dependent Clp protease ATP-binding subunit ClpB
LGDRKIEIDMDNRAREWLAQAGYDPVYGARPLKRVIQRRLQDPLAELLLEGRVSDGTMINVSAGKRGLTINGMQFALGESDLMQESAPSHALH